MVTKIPPLIIVVSLLIVLAVKPYDRQILLQPVGACQRTESVIDQPLFPNPYNGAMLEPMCR